MSVILCGGYGRSGDPWGLSGKVMWELRRKRVLAQTRPRREEISQGDRRVTVGIVGIWAWVFQRAGTGDRLRFGKSPGPCL